jgi:hypothetical protein
MPNRILLCVSVMLASFALAEIPYAARAADDDCLTSPGKTTSAGGHWRYHLERGTGRKCWYLSQPEKSDATQSDDAEADPPKPATKITPSLERAAASPPDRPVVAKPVAQGAPPAQVPANPFIQAPANNARAEFIDAPRIDQLATSTPHAQIDQPPATAPEPAATQGAVSTRWPSPAETLATNNNVAPESSPAAAPQPAATPQPEPVSTNPTATDAQPVDAPEGPDYLLYALIAVTLAFAGVVALIGVQFLVARLRDWREERNWQRQMRSHDRSRGDGLLAMNEMPMGLVPAADGAEARPQMHRARPERQESRRVDDEIDEIEQLLVLTRQASVQAQLAPWDGHAPRDAAE